MGLSDKFLDKELKKLRKDLEEGFSDFSEPTDSAFGSPNTYALRKKKKNKGQKVLKKQKSNDPTTISSAKG